VKKKRTKKQLVVLDIDCVDFLLTRNKIKRLVEFIFPRSSFLLLQEKYIHQLVKYSIEDEMKE
jgi:hypothetical protein